MASQRLSVTPQQMLAFRRRIGSLDQRLPPEPDSLRRAAWAGLQDSMPRAALLSIHARVAGTAPDVLEDPALVQVWGPRFSVFVVPATDVAPFTLGRMPDGGPRMRRAVEAAEQLADLLGDSRMTYSEAGRALGVPPNSLRYATLTGRVLLDWDGARRPTIRMIPPPADDPGEARLELVRRYLHVFGPATPGSFAGWAGIKPVAAKAAFVALGKSLLAVSTPLGEAWILEGDEPELRAPAAPPAPARLLPSGDPYYLLWGDDRTVLVAEAARRDLLWTSRVWPGGVVVDGEVAGTWRRSKGRLTIAPWRRLTARELDAVEAEAISLPLPGTDGEISIEWAGTGKPS